jgi:hypothetical protein
MSAVQARSRRCTERETRYMFTLWYVSLPFRLATMGSSHSHTQLELNTDDSDRPSRSSSRTYTNDAQYPKCQWSRQSIQSDQGSISNSTDHNNVSVNDRDSLRLSKEGLVSRNFSVSGSSRGRDSSVSDRKSFFSLCKSAFRHRIQSQSTICTSQGAGSGSLSHAPSTPFHKFSPLSAPSIQDNISSSTTAPIPRGTVPNPRPMSLPPQPYTPSHSGTSSERPRQYGEQPHASAQRHSRRGVDPNKQRTANRILGDYTVSKILGAGSMGKVKLAHHNITGEKVRTHTILFLLSSLLPCAYFPFVYHSRPFLQHSSL